MKKIAILPTLMTLGNGVCGFSAIVYASKIVNDNDETNVYFAYAAWLLVAAMFFDVLDGFIARLSKTASEFGGQLDSLCDAISFGAAPAFLLFKLSWEWENSRLMGNATVVIAVFFMVCVILRLARFNVENTPDPASHRRFKGLPSPAGAGCILSLAILRSLPPSNPANLPPDVVREVVKYWAPLGGLIIALLMVSRVSYPHLTKQVLRGRRHHTYLLRIIFVVFVLALAQQLALVIVFWGYALIFAVRYLILRARRRSPGGDGGRSIMDGEERPAA